MDNEGMQQLRKEEKMLVKGQKIRKAVSNVMTSVRSLQWELDRMSSGGQSEYRKLLLQTKRLEKLCR